MMQVFNAQGTAICIPFYRPVPISHLKQIIKNKKKEIGRHKLLTEWIQNDTIDPKERLAGLIPGIAFYIAGFPDLNTYALRYSKPKDELERAINGHTIEDSTHLPLFIKDCKEIFDADKQSYIAWLQEFWGYKHEYARKALYRCMAIAYQHQDAALRYIFIEAIEATGRHFFKNTCKVAIEYEEKYSRELLYFGPEHLARESGHIMNATETEDFAVLKKRVILEAKGELNSSFQNDKQTEDAFDKCVFSQEDAEKAEEIIEETFELFSNFWSEVLTGCLSRKTK